MAKRKPLMVVGILVTKDDQGNRIEKEFIPEKETKKIKDSLIDNAMASAGYTRSGV